MSLLNISKVKDTPKYFGKEKEELELIRDKLFKRKGFFL